MLAHELGHFRHRHVQQRIVVMFARQPGGLALLGWLAGAERFLLPGWGGANLAASNDGLALLLFLMAGCRCSVLHLAAFGAAVAAA